MSTPRLQKLLSFLQSSPEEPFLVFALAKEYENLGQREEALRYYNQLLEQNPDYVATYYHLGKLQEAIGEPGEAFALYKKGMVVAQKAGDQHALNELAAAKLNLGDEEDFA